MTVIIERSKTFPILPVAIDEMIPCWAIGWVWKLARRQSTVSLELDLLGKSAVFHEMIFSPKGAAYLVFQGISLR